MNRCGWALLVAAMGTTAAGAQEDVYHMTGRDFLYGRGASYGRPVIRSGGYGLPVVPGGGGGSSSRHHRAKKPAPPANTSILIGNQAPGPVQFATAFGSGSWTVMTLPQGQQIALTGKGTPHARFPNSAGQLITYDLRPQSTNVFALTKNRGLDLVYQPPQQQQQQPVEAAAQPSASAAEPSPAPSPAYSPPANPFFGTVAPSPAPSPSR